jgi:hypothetical protein
MPPKNERRDPRTRPRRPRGRRRGPPDPVRAARLAQQQERARGLRLLGAEAPIIEGPPAPSAEVRNYGCHHHDVEVIRDFTWTPYGSDSLERVWSTGCSFAQRIMR